ncbi:hypothetical protein EON65_09680 [archaeon]|nr:MAG: hypothetical protein EON65_09680 [archaeon]
MSFKCFLSWVIDCLVFQGENVSLFGHPIEQVWVQGVVVVLDEENQELIIDDGTSTIVVAYPSARMLDPPTLGSYVSVQGVVILGEDESGEEIRYIEAKRLQVLSDFNLESLWPIEIMQALKYRQAPPT